MHVYGQVQILEGGDALKVVEDLAAKHEGGFKSPWEFNRGDGEAASLLKGIVAFEVRVERIEGKAKLNQNLSPEDFDGVVEALTLSEHTEQRQLSMIMTEMKEHKYLS